jgi:kynurenine--oxoglutarate transaminase/cysteine-S-conjugate beta-lyase/glutamine--phenylpyruvate transaminase
MITTKGDEVIILEPAFDIYPAQVQMAGGVSKYVPLRLNIDTRKWDLDYTELESTITSRTRLLILNTPHNPTGKVFTEKELYIIRDILLRNPHVIAVCDEVYEKLVFDGNKHIRLASLPDMWDHSLTVSSIGKTFSVTGWKVGWIYGSEKLIYPVMLANQWVQFSVSTPTQVACAAILSKAEEPYEGYESYYEYVRDLYEKKRNYLTASLTAAHLNPVVPEGGFFIIADTSSHKVIDQEFFDEASPTGESPVSRDWAFARHLSNRWGVTPIPPSAFYTKERVLDAANLGSYLLLT